LAAYSAPADPRRKRFGRRESITPRDA